MLNDSKNYPVYILTFSKNNKIPDYVTISINDLKEKGFTIMPLQVDNRELNSLYMGKPLKAYHAGFTWLRDKAMHYILDYVNKNPNVKGVFICEGDICLEKDYNFNKFLAEDHSILNNPTWLGYKKKLSNYIVGNFMLYFPISSLNKLNDYFQKQKRFVYSDRFFTKLTYNEKFINLVSKTRATEIEHYSNVINDIRKEPRATIKIK